MVKKVLCLVFVLLIFASVVSFALTDEEKADLNEKLEHAHFMVRKLSYYFVLRQTPELYWRLIYWRGECTKLMEEAKGI